MCVILAALSFAGTDVYLYGPDQTPPPRELKVSDPKVRDLSLLQLQLVPTAVLYIKFLDESLNRELALKQLDAPLSFTRRQRCPGSLDPACVDCCDRPPATAEYK